MTARGRECVRECVCECVHDQLAASRVGRDCDAGCGDESSKNAVFHVQEQNNEVKPACALRHVLRH